MQYRGHTLLVGLDIVELCRQGVVSVGAAHALPAQAVPGGFALSLAVQPAGALGCAQGELAGVEVGGVALAVVTIVHTLAARPSHAVARGLAEGLAQVAAGGEQVLQVAQADGLLAADAVTIAVTHAAGLAEGHAAG